MSTSPQPAGSSRLGSAIRITLPVSVAYDLEKFQTALANVARAGGHPFCTSVTDLTFELVKVWAIDPESLQPVEQGGTVEG